MSDLLAPLLTAPAWVVLLITFLVVFAEDALFVGFVLPGETAAILSGVAASLGHVELWIAIPVVIAAAITGDSVGYEVGKHFGPRLISSRPLRRHQHQIAKAQLFLAERGGWAVFLGRWTAFFRAVMPALAGSANMPYPKFLAFNALGGIFWGAVVVSAGFIAGQSYAQLEKFFGRTLTVVLVVALVLWLTIRHFRKDRAELDPE